MVNMKLEVCCYSINDVITAINHGADRIEFCAGRNEGGLTPSYGDLLQLSQLKLPVAIHPIIRPRGGDFYYSQTEINSMINDIQLARELDYPGVVFGCLVTNGQLDIINLLKLIKAADGLSITFHRAFDVCVDPILALNQLNDLGIDRILTSGQQQDAVKGIKLIEQLHQLSQSTLIMPGCGIRSTNLALFKAIGITEFHSSASRSLPSPMQYQNQNVCMSHTKQDEFIRFSIDPDELEKMKQLLL